MKQEKVIMYAKNKVSIEHTLEEPVKNMTGNMSKKTKLKTTYGERTTKNTKKSKIQNRNKHKEDITKPKFKEKRLCECGCWVSLRNMASHNKNYETSRTDGKSS